MGASGSVPEERKAELGGKGVAAFRRAVQLFELDPEGLLVMMNCIITEATAGEQTLAEYLAAEEHKCVLQI